MGPPFAAGASRIVPRDACRDRADDVRFRLLPRADVHRRLSLRAVPVGDARSRLAHRELRSASRRTARQAGRSQGRFPPHGDCIDCGMCTDTCPTGIDIREGLQLECIACTQCIDACNGVMERIGKPKG